LVTKSIRSTLASLLGIALLATSLAVAVSTDTASADTAIASAQAADGTLLDFPAEVRTGAPGMVTPDDDTPLPTPPALNVGVLGQDTFVDEFGHSVACAGLIASNASINILSGANGCANADAGTGVELNLTGLITVRLDAVYAQCTAGSNQLPTAQAFVLGNAQILVLGNVIATVPTTGSVDVNPGSITPPAVAALLSLAGIDINLLPLLRLTFEETNVGTTKGSGASARALHLELLGLIDQSIGVVSCGPNAVTGDTGALQIDTSGDINSDNDPATNTVQDGTRNALNFRYTPAGDRSGTRVTFVINPNKLEFDPTDPAFAGCDPVGLNDPSTSCTVAGNGPGGIVNGGSTVNRTVPVKIKPGITGTLDPEDAVATLSNGAEPGGDLVRQIPSTPIFSETSTITVQAGGNAPQAGVPAGTRLPINIPGELYVDMPYYVEYVEYAGVACTLHDNDEPPFVIPAVYDPNLVPAQRNLFACDGSARANDELRITVAPDAPTNVDGTGRVIIRRTGPINPLTPPAIPNNTYTSDVIIDVTAGPPPVQPGAVNLLASVAPSSRPEPGGDFTYTVEVRNTSNVSATIQALTQRIRNNGGNFVAGPNPAGSANCKVGTVLAANQACSYTLVDPLTGVTGDTETHEFNASLKPNNASPAVTDPTPPSATAVIGNRHTIAVNKSAAIDERPAPGGDFTYDVTITNADDQFDGNNTIGSIVDVIEGKADVNLVGDDDCKVGTVLAEGQSCTFQFTLPFTGVEGAHQTDTVQVTGTAADGNSAYGEDEETVLLTAPIDTTTPGLVVTKTATPDRIDEPGGTFTYRVTVQNTLGTDATLTGLTDAIVVDGKAQTASSLNGKGDCKTGVVIKPGAANAYTCTFTREFTGNAGDRETDQVVATAKAGNTTATGSALETVELADVLPRIRVDESVDPAARKTPGGEFTWKVTITNESKASSDPVQVTSLRNELLLDLEKDPNCAKLLGLLDVGQSKSCTFTTKVEGPDGKVGSDIVVAPARDDEGNQVSDLGTAAVSLTAEVAAQQVTPTTVRTSMPKTGANTRTTAAAAMLFAGLGLVLTGGGMQQAPELALGDQRRRRRR
jgi:hypothetical protein